MSLFSRLKKGLSRSRQNLGDSIAQIFGGRKIDAATLQELEDHLIGADLGLETSDEIIALLRAQKQDHAPSPQEVRQLLINSIADILTPRMAAFEIPEDKKPAVILMAGVNGAGKTTSIGKLAHKFKMGGKSVMLAAGDTFRAAAIEQLQIWGERAGVHVVTTQQGGDAASLAYTAYEKAKTDGTDILLIDTAGRLQSNENLMAELTKIIRVLRKHDETAPHHSLLVLDATVGQNAISQAEGFQAAAETSGLIMTKLDGTARGGVLVALARKLALPIYFIGVGEGQDDLQPFDAADFARALIGDDEIGDKDA